MEKPCWTPLHTAAREGDVKRLQKCMGEIEWLQPMDVNAKTANGHTPLHMSAANGHTEAMGVLIKEKADLDSQTISGNTPLHLSAMGGHQDSCKALISQGADVRKVNKKGSSIADVCPTKLQDLKGMLEKEIREKGGVSTSMQEV
mmetsp:Transcript_14658/g.22771  ORF Transcript_14658/g.22771 Transcript_14658/m.22771 type:complete len:145 (+) Transcript_14658:148-582(+)